MGSLDTRVNWEALRSRDTATFTGSYQALGAPLAHDCVLVKIINESNVGVTVSRDAITDEDRLSASGGFFLYDLQANASREGGLRVRAGTQFYIKGSSGTGSVYLVAIYAGV